MWCRRFLTNPFHFSPLGKGFVNRSASFLCVLTYVVLHSSCADRELCYGEHGKIIGTALAAYAGFVFIGHQIATKLEAQNDNGPCLRWSDQSHLIS